MPGTKKVRCFQKAMLVLSVAFFYVPPFLFAFSFPPRPTARVNDYADLLSPAEEAEIETRLADFERETSNQIVVAIFSSLEGEILEDFTLRLAEQWEVGQKGKDNGVILAIFKEDRAVRIEVGYGLEGVLPDATAHSIIRNEIVPRLRAGSFDEGISAAVSAIIAATKGEYQAVPSSAKPMAYFGQAMLAGIFLGAFAPLIFLRFFFAIGVLGVLLAPFRNSLAGLFYGISLGVTPLVFYYLFGRNLKGHTVLSSRGAVHSGSFFGGGGGFGGGGFSGGGGSFGGGGASGRW